MYCPGRNGGSPVTFAYSFASASIVGEAYASMIATVCPRPVMPDAVTP